MLSIERLISERAVVDRFTVTTDMPVSRNVAMCYDRKSAFSGHKYIVAASPLSTSLSQQVEDDLTWVSRMKSGTGGCVILLICSFLLGDFYLDVL